VKECRSDAGAPGGQHAAVSDVGQVDAGAGRKPGRPDHTQSSIAHT